jgi:ubiquitin-protein ligase
MNLRVRRLEADWAAVQSVLCDHPKIRLVGTAGTPPQRYHIEYNLKGLEQKADGSIVVRDKHLVEITLLRSYPCLPPFCRMLSPVYHPNIAPHAICIGDHWAAGESLVQIIIQIGEMIAFQRYNIKSPLNGQAAKWVEANMTSLPTDDSPLLLSDYRAPPVSDPTIGGGGRIIQPPAAQPETCPEPVIIFRCPACNTKLSAKQKYTGLPVTCPKCGAESRIPSGVEKS